MTDREKAIVMAFTGICMLTGEKMNVFYQYLSELYGRQVYTHELLTLDIKEKSTPDFLRLCKKEEPEQKTGRFIGTEYDGYADGNPVFYEWQCSKCGCVFEDEEPTYNFCPNCGADMRGEQDE